MSDDSETIELSDRIEEHVDVPEDDSYTTIKSIDVDFNREITLDNHSEQITVYEDRVETRNGCTAAVEGVRLAVKSLKEDTERHLGPIKVGGIEVSHRKLRNSNEIEVRGEVSMYSRADELLDAIDTIKHGE